MKQFDEKELHELLLCYEVSGPSNELVSGTKRLMLEEALHPALEPSWADRWVIMLAGLAVILTLCLFYVFTVGTILRFILPANMLELVYHSLYAFTAVGCSLLVCIIMVFYFKKTVSPQTEML